MRTINYNSDFKIVEGFKDGSRIDAAPFRFTYYTKVTRGTHVAEYNGKEFKGCHPTDDGKVVIPFDGHNFGMGVLNVKREFFLNDSDYADGVCNLVSVEATGIILDNGATSDIGEIDVQLEPYYHTIGGGTSSDIPDGSVTEGKLANNAVSTSKIKDGAVTEDKLSEAVRTKLNAEGGYKPPIGGIPLGDLSEAVQQSLSKADTALQEHQDLSEYAKLSDVQEITDDLVTKDAHSSDIEGLRAEVDNLEATMITASPSEGEQVEDFILMASDVQKELGDSDLPISQAAVKNAINSISEMIVSVINTPT